MIRAALRGLRGRLLLSFVATSAVTLVVAAAITLGPLQSRLRTQSETALQKATEDTRYDFGQVLERTANPRKGESDLEQAAQCLQLAVKLAPGKLQKAEEYHLKLVRLRQKNKKADVLDDLFGVRYVDDKGGYTPGKLAAAEKKKLPAAAVPIVQQLGLWLPGDGRTQQGTGRRLRRQILR